MELENSRGPKLRPTHKSSWYKNWTVHNLVSHPLSEVVYWLVLPFSRTRAEKVSNWVHDVTIPEEK
jgi:hypothetical protein